MLKLRTALIASLSLTALTLAPAAHAHGGFRHGGGFGPFGAVAGAAAAIVTAPFYLLGAAAQAVTPAPVYYPQASYPQQSYYPPSAPASYPAASYYQPAYQQPSYQQPYQQSTYSPQSNASPYGVPPDYREPTPPAQYYPAQQGYYGPR